MSMLLTLHGRFLAVTILAGLSVPGAAGGQERSGLPDELRGWLDAQRQGWAAVRAVTFVEQADRSIDGPTGLRVIETVLGVAVDLIEPNVSWTTRSAIVDGEEVPGSSLEHFGERWRRDPVSRARRRLAVNQLGVGYLSRMKPIGTLKSERREGMETLRLDLTPAVDGTAVEQVTLWFDREGARLLQSRTILHAPSRETSLVAETTFERVDGLDVPIERSVQGTVRSKRRMRWFTTLIAVNSVLSDYRIAR